MFTSRLATMGAFSTVDLADSPASIIASSAPSAVADAEEEVIEPDAHADSTNAITTKVAPQRNIVDVKKDFSIEWDTFISDYVERLAEYYEYMQSVPDAPIHKGASLFISFIHQREAVLGASTSYG